MKAYGAAVFTVVLSAALMVPRSSAEGVREKVEPGLFHSDFPGKWIYSGGSSEFVLSADTAQVIRSPYDVSWNGIVTLRGGVDASFKPIVNEGLGEYGPGTIIVSNVPLYSGNYPEYTLSLYRPEAGGPSSLDAVFSDGTYLNFSSVIAFEYSGNELVLHRSEMTAQPGQHGGSVIIEGQAYAPMAAVSPGKPAVLPGPLPQGKEHGLIERLRIYPDGNCSGVLILGGVTTDFSGRAGISENMISFLLDGGADGFPLVYGFHFSSNNEVALIREIPLQDRERIETRFGFRPGTLASAVLRETSLFTRDTVP